MRKALGLGLASVVAGVAGYLYYLKLRRDKEQLQAKKLKLELELRQAREQEWNRRILVLKLSTVVLSMGVSFYLARRFVSKS
jgi:hypothetical protein